MKVEVKVHSTRRDWIIRRIGNCDEVLTCYVSQDEMDYVVNLLLKKQSQYEND